MESVLFHKAVWNRREIVPCDSLRHIRCQTRFLTLYSLVRLHPKPRWATQYSQRWYVIDHWVSLAKNLWIFVYDIQKAGRTHQQVDVLFLLVVGGLRLTWCWHCRWCWCFGKRLITSYFSNTAHAHGHGKQEVPTSARPKEYDGKSVTFSLSKSSLFPIVCLRYCLRHVLQELRGSFSLSSINWRARNGTKSDSLSLSHRQGRKLRSTVLGLTTGNLM